MTTNPSRIPTRLPFLLYTLALVAAVVATAAIVRFGLIEPPRFSWACQTVDAPWWCPLRIAGIASLRFGVLGIAALVSGLVALLSCGRRMAWAALGLGAAGLVLYAPELSAGGALLGAMALLRR
jgi:hypothetical protein